MDRSTDLMRQRAVLRVFFEEPFWVGVFECIREDCVSVSKVTFGAEPKDYEVLAFLLENYDKLRFSPSVKTVVKETGSNPKRMQRIVGRELKEPGIGTKSQQALKLQQELAKTERRIYSREQKEAEKEQRFARKQQKRKEKHRGR